MAMKQPYGAVTYADPGLQSDKVKRYPVNTREHIIAAWQFIHHSNDADKYTPAQVTTIEDNILAAAKKMGIKLGQDSN
jgi:hypothetical protein